MASLRSFLAMLAVLGLSGCVSGLKYGAVKHSELSAGQVCNPQAQQDVDISEKPFFAVTSRLPDCQSGTAKLTAYRGGKIRYGRFGLRPPENKRVKEASVELAIQAEQDWWTNLEVAANTHDGKILLYVHGYRAKFGLGARDTAQIQRLSKFDGPVVHYSWPSAGKLLTYVTDQTAVASDAINFRRFLRNLAEKPWAKDILIISHSMGTRLVIPGIVFVDRTAKFNDANNISQIILASPDSDRQIFEKNIAPRLLSPRRVKAGRRMTIYVSNKDRALKASRTLHGYPRLGRPYCFNPFNADSLRDRGLPVRCYPTHIGTRSIGSDDGLTIVDTTGVSVSSGHSDYLRSAAACADFIATLRGESPPRTATYLPHVFRLPAYGKKEQPAHNATCMRYFKDSDEG